jgi:hypothetical protein
MCHLTETIEPFALCSTSHALCNVWYAAWSARVGYVTTDACADTEPTIHSAVVLHCLGIRLL